MMDLRFSCNGLLLTQSRGINVQTLHLLCVFFSNKEEHLRRKIIVVILSQIIFQEENLCA